MSCWLPHTPASLSAVWVRAACSRARRELTELRRARAGGVALGEEEVVAVADELFIGDLAHVRDGPIVTTGDLGVARHLAR